MVLVKGLAFRETQSDQSQETVVRPLGIVNRVPDLPEADRGLQHSAYVQNTLTGSAEHVCYRTGQILLPALGILRLNQTVCITGWKMLVIQDPDSHVPLLCLFQDDVHVMPPAWAAEIVMRPGLHADGPDAASGDLLDLTSQEALIFTAHPEERENGSFHCLPPL